MLDMVIHSEVFGGCANDFDALERVVSSVDSHTSPRQWLYNRRLELVGASGTQANPYDYAYSYDSIGNRLTSSDDFGTATYAANCLNQYTVVNRTIEQLVLRSLNEGGSNNLTCDADGNLTQDDRFTYDKTPIYTVRQIPVDKTYIIKPYVSEEEEREIVSLYWQANRDFELNSCQAATDDEVQWHLRHGFKRLIETQGNTREGYDVFIKK